jgi:WD40 repeat protein
LQTDIANENKAAQLYDVNTFLGLDANRLARWDMRTPGGVVQTTPEAGLTWAGGKDFARGTNFTCMATSGDGYVVVGSKDGRIRLYNGSTLTQAKTSIPGLGKPITAVDVTYDGRFVLATTDSYLMVVKTTWEQNGTLWEGGRT